MGVGKTDVEDVTDGTDLFFFPRYITYALHALLREFMLTRPVTLSKTVSAKCSNFGSDTELQKQQYLYS